MYFLQVTQTDPPSELDEDGYAVVLIPYVESDAVVDPTTGLFLHPDSTFELGKQLGVITFPIDDKHFSPGMPSTTYLVSGVVLLENSEESFQLEVVAVDPSAAASDDPFEELNLSFTKEVGGCNCKTQR